MEKEPTARRKTKTKRKRTKNTSEPSVVKEKKKKETEKQVQEVSQSVPDPDPPAAEPTSEQPMNVFNVNVSRMMSERFKEYRRNTNRITNEILRAQEIFAKNYPEIGKQLQSMEERVGVLESGLEQLQQETEEAIRQYFLLDTVKPYDNAEDLNFSPTEAKTQNPFFVITSINHPNRSLFAENKLHPIPNMDSVRGHEVNSVAIQRRIETEDSRIPSQDTTSSGFMATDPTGGQVVITTNYLDALHHHDNALESPSADIQEPPSDTPTE